MKSNSEIVDLIKDLYIEKGMSMSELARQVDMAKSALSRYFNKQREFPLNRISDFAKVLNVKPEYLLGINEELYNNTNKTVAIPTIPLLSIYNSLEPPRQKKLVDFAKEQLKAQENTNIYTYNLDRNNLIREKNIPYTIKRDSKKKKIPIYKINIIEKLAAGYRHYLADIPQEYVAYIRENPNTLPDYDFASIVDGYSMTPDYNNGDIVLIKQGYDFLNGNVYAIAYDDETFLKKVYFKKNEIVLQSINIEYKDIHIPICDDRVDIRIIGKVVGKLKPIKIRNKD